ncbi:hypothetical protein H010_00875 [Hydrogenophaga taeniospiralis CCUG 15921]|uniref:Uncharacterized protein n=1 Tax=Hydrogenophaga taeniospiralis CCUG 15921 TaxID=1281780 RepID=A0A9X4NMQ7_9BURK|nr:hypothetical protein [Hydrogenophaga taeniospiralis CCUG 15921]
MLCFLEFPEPLNALLLFCFEVSMPLEQGRVRRGKRHDRGRTWTECRSRWLRCRGDRRSLRLSQIGVKRDADERVKTDADALAVLPRKGFESG